MNFKRNVTQNVLLISIIGSLGIYYVYQYFRIESLMDDIEYENAMFVDEENVQQLEPKPLATPEYKHLMFQSNAEIEFPTEWFGRPKIPHIIHIVYKNATIPFGFSTFVRSYFIDNPNWEFRFWTFKSGRQLIENYHPYLLEHFDSWNDTVDNNKKKSTLIRHVALYEYGGFTADLDVEIRRPLDIATKKYSCIIPAEPFEHSVILFNFDFILSTRVMMCRPKHPFFKHLLEHIKKTESKQDYFDATGGGRLTNVFFSYNNMNMTDVQKRKIDDSSNSPFCYRGERKEDDDDAVYVPNTQYFNDNIHPSLLDSARNLKACSIDSLQAYIKKRACAEFASRKELRQKKAYAFTSCHFYHIWEKHYTPRVLHIKKIIPKVIFYKG